MAEFTIIFGVSLSIHELKKLVLDSLGQTAVKNACMVVTILNSIAFCA